ncbi:glucan -beta-glucosidase [Colletotrichum musicola]|uniref:glucan 1,3-beta-glucosidase n=1 Tax=Colletotrichum musicola TaxID=2175873 RepID=A0A8H6MMH5_9PEZI|nr:glucan -beta-glucosidase [Colletotrichum musicola]
MRASIIIASVAALAPAVAAAPGALGFALGAKQPDGQCKYQADYEADFKAIRDASGSSIVRVYAADQCNTAQYILPAAKSQNFQVILGVWADTEESYAADKAAVVRHTPGFERQVYAVTVGSESLYRGNFTGPELAEKLKDMKRAVPHLKVGTADSWNKYQDGTADAVIPHADILLTNAFSYWQGQARDNATASFFDSIMQAFSRIQRVSGAGWPSDGAKYELAEPGLTNAETFYRDSVCGMVYWGFNVFFFEAFDEPWKPEAIGENGFAAPEVHWGGMKADRRAKYSLQCV